MQGKTRTKSTFSPRGAEKVDLISGEYETWQETRMDTNLTGYYEK